MITTRIQIESYLAEYVRGKYYDETVGTVRFPSSSDIYVTVYDLMEKRPVNCPADRGNLEFMLPDRREANFAGGKSPEAAKSAPKPPCAPPVPCSKAAWPKRS